MTDNGTDGTDNGTGQWTDLGALIARIDELEKKIKPFRLDDYESWPPGPLCDEQIHWLAVNLAMIHPYEPKAVRNNAKNERILSYGLGSYGYDFRVQPKWKVFTPTGWNHVVDPKAMDQHAFVELAGDSVVIPPNGFVLAVSTERFKVPKDVICVVFTKSSYARCGVAMQLTPLEPEWEGFVTVEIGNTTPHGARVHANEGVGQVIFLKGSRPCAKTYANKNEGGEAGKYQKQESEIVLPRM